MPAARPERSQDAAYNSGISHAVMSEPISNRFPIALIDFGASVISVIE
jgi:hypothetical protein